MRALVTGAAGFIGSKLAGRLAELGNEVVGLDDLSDGSPENLSAWPEVDLRRADLRDAAAVRDAARGCSVIFHLGAMRSVPRSMDMPGPTTDVNVMGTLNVLTAAFDRGARVVFASSSSVYGDQARYPLVETMDPAPRSPYAASKLAGEIYCRTWWRTFGVPTMSLRYFNVYGPGQDPYGEYAVVVPRFILACLSGERPVVHGDGRQSRDFTYVDDVVEATILAAHAPPDAYGEVFNIGGGKLPTSINDILAIVAELTGTSPDPLWAPARPGDVRRTEADISKARRLLGYSPSTPAPAGLSATVEWFRTAEVTPR